MPNLVDVRSALLVRGGPLGSGSKAVAIDVHREIIAMFGAELLFDGLVCFVRRVDHDPESRSGSGRDGCGLPVPGQQVGNLTGRMIRQAPHQFRTRKNANKTRQTHSKLNENATTSMKLIDCPPLITVWLQVRILLGRLFAPDLRAPLLVLPTWVYEAIEGRQPIRTPRFLILRQKEF